VEVTEFNPRAIKSFEKDGFLISKKDSSSPINAVKNSRCRQTIFWFFQVLWRSKQSAKGFAAVMTCDHADQNCHVIKGAKIRIPLRYDDPKLFDGTVQEEAKYSVPSHQIGAELFFLSNKSNIN
jgi:arsenate reductase